jgi:hypothetical protein
MRSAHASETWSSSGPLFEGSPLGVNESELGDSDKASRRIESVSGVMVLVREKMWSSGFNGDGMEWLRVGKNVVGGSYLLRVEG